MKGRALSSLVSLLIVGVSACSDDPASSASVANDGGIDASDTGSSIEPHDGGGTVDADADSVVVRPPGVLVFFGHSSVDTGVFAHAELEARYSAKGLTVTHTKTWPSTLADFRLVVLVVPGMQSDTDLFLDGETNQLRAFVQAGHTLVIENETTSYAGTIVINDLVTKLGVQARARDAVLANPQAKIIDLPSHPLLAGVTSLGFETSGAVDNGSATCLAAQGADCLLSVEPLGAGIVVLSGDVQVLGSAQVADNSLTGNRIFADHLAHL